MTTPSARPPTGVQQPPETLVYATWLTWGARVGFVMLLLGFGLMVLGVVPSHVPPETLPQLWSLPLKDYLLRAQMPTGWGWLALLPKGDALGLLGIVALSASSIGCLLAVAPRFWRQGDRGLALMAWAIVGVMVLAASGWLSGGHA